MAAVNEVLQIGQEVQVNAVLLVPASVSSGMTYRAFWTCLDEQGILVTVKKDLLYPFKALRNKLRCRDNKTAVLHELSDLGAVAVRK